MRISATDCRRRFRDRSRRERAWSLDRLLGRVSGLALACLARAGGRGCGPRARNPLHAGAEGGSVL